MSGKGNAPLCEWGGAFHVYNDCIFSCDNKVTKITRRNIVFNKISSQYEIFQNRNNFKETLIKIYILPGSCIVLTVFRARKFLHGLI